VYAEALITDLMGDESVQGYVINIRDVTERMQFEDRLSHQAFHDLTTGLANRALLCSRTVHALERHEPGAAPVAMLVLDLDDFKAINDGLGYVAGDQLLTAVGSRLASSTRAGDTIARIGGDEFAILLEASPDGDAVATACRVHDLLEQPFVFEGREVFAHASIGIAFADISTSGDLGAEQLLRDADVAMYAASTTGWRSRTISSSRSSAASSRCTTSRSCGWPEERPVGSRPCCVGTIRRAATCRRSTSSRSRRRPA
jgi:diguanylate cyclase (GGDEF)-like protein